MRNIFTISSLNEMTYSKLSVNLINHFCLHYQLFLKDIIDRSSKPKDILDRPPTIRMAIGLHTKKIAQSITENSPYMQLLPI